VYVLGQSYLAAKPLTFDQLAAEPRMEQCTVASFDIGFRIVLEQ
jgi:hypothetical protein